MAKSKRRLIDLQFPVAGLDRARPYRGQPPFSTPDAENVWPRDPIEGRSRGGSRPGLSKLFNQQLGSGTPIRLLNSLSIVDTTGYHYWADSFDGEELSGVWAAAWGGTAPSITDASFASIAYNTTVRAVRDALDPVLDATKAYSIEMMIVPYGGAHNGTYRLYAKLNDTTPDIAVEGVVGELTLTGSTTVTTSGSIKIYKASALVTTMAFTTTSCPTVPVAGWFRLYFDGTTYKAYWDGVELVSATEATAMTNKRVGFGATCSVAGGICLIDSFRAQYYQATTLEMRRTLLMASAGGTLYKETFLGDFAAVSSNLTLASDRHLDAQDREQLLYIADHGEILTKGTTGTITTGVLATSGAAIDWTTLGISTYDHVAVITDHSAGGTADGVFAIATIAAGGLTLTSPPANGTCSWRVERGPKKYDPVANTLTAMLATTGTAPTGCRLLAMYRGRLVLASSPEYPHQWWMSRNDDPLDWLDTLDEEDATRPMSGDSEAGAGMIGEPITALVPLSDDYLVFGCQNSLHLLRGDPAYGGELDNVSRKCGIIARNAYAVGPAGELIFLSRDGLQFFVPGQPIQGLSRDRLPSELIDVDTERFTISMQWDVRNRGIHLYLTGKDEAKRRHWFFDLVNKGFWPMRIADDMEPFAACWYPSLAADQVCMAIGCRDGYVRRFSELNDLDGTAEIESYVFYGPFLPGGSDYYDGLIVELLGLLDENSGAVDWGIYAGDTIQSAFNATARPTGTWTAGRNYTEHPRARGSALFVKIENGAKKRWAIDSLMAKLEMGGMAKRA